MAACIEAHPQLSAGMVASTGPGTLVTLTPSPAVVRLGRAGGRAGGAFGVVSRVTGLFVVLPARLPSGCHARLSASLFFRDWLCVWAPAPSCSCPFGFPKRSPFTARLQGTFLFKTHGNVSPAAGVCGASCRHVCPKALGCSHAGSGQQGSEGLSPRGWSPWTRDSSCPSPAGVAPVSPFFSAACEDTMAHRWLPLGLACLWQPARVGTSSWA